MLELRGLRAGYGSLPVLFDIDLEVAAGEMVSVLGANGAGKSTLLKTILGVLAPTTGEILFREQRITAAPAHKRVALGISLSPEGRRVFPSLSVRENLLTGAYGIGPTHLKDAYERVYELFPRLRERRGQAAGSLSGGEQQMLAIGRALMSKPRLLLVDELSLGLAPVISERLYEALRSLCDEGLAVIMVEQHHLVTEGFVDRQLFLEKGRFTGAVATPRRPAHRAAATATLELPAVATGDEPAKES